MNVLALQIVVISLPSLPVSTCRSCYLRSRPTNSFVIIIPPPFVIYVIALQNSFVIIVTSKQLPFIHCCYLRSRPTNSLVVIISPGHTRSYPFVIYVLDPQNSFVTIVASEHLPFIHYRSVGYTLPLCTFSPCKLSLLSFIPYH